MPRKVPALPRLHSIETIRHSDLYPLRPCRIEDIPAHLSRINTRDPRTPGIWRAHLLIRRTRNRQPPISIPDVGLGSALQQGDSGIAVALGDGVMQRRAPIRIRRIDRALVIQQQRDEWGAPSRRCPVDRQLSSAVLRPGAGLMRRPQEESAQRKILLRYSEVQRRLPRSRLGVHVGPAREKEGDEGFAVFDRAGDLERCPTAAVDGVYVEGGLAREEGHDRQVAAANRPVERKPVVAVTA